MIKIIEKLKKALEAIKTYSETYKPETYEKAKAALTLTGMIAEEALDTVKELEAMKTALPSSSPLF